jgi:Heterokaryon incompatibility protein (HET)
LSNRRRLDSPGPSITHYKGLDLAKEWLKDCLKSHHKCTNQNSYGYPTRLLAVGSGVARLVLSSEMPDELKYATLSHCWGNSMHLKLKTSNLNNFRVQLPEMELCKTFKDAIAIAKYLDLEYLWIDSLCIVQDDPEDWRRESVRMSDIYGYSSINIAATSARDGRIGCFFERKASAVKGIPIYTKNQKILYDLVPRSVYNALRDAPLCNRAWAFQERFLAPRTLHFTDSQIFWECKESQACEIFPEGSPEVLLREHLLPKANLALSDLWYRCVSLYSKGTLTYETDRLVAISGVVNWFQGRQMNNEYLAGMWRRDLEIQLCWRVLKPQDTGQTTESACYLAPSWSWASVKSPIKFSNILQDSASYERSRITINSIVLGAHVTLVNEETPLGQIRDGTLRVAFSDIACGYKDNSVENQGRIVTPDDPSTTLLRGDKIYWDGPTKTGKLVYVLTFLVYHAVDRKDFSEGILLEETGQSVGEFRRIGCFHGFLERGVRSVPNMSLFDDIGKGGTECYVVTIV